MGAPGKRMRLGTKSCAECRRRKVRCIFVPGQDRCDACLSHGSSCVPQEKQSPQDTIDSGAGTEDVVALKKRLDELETLMRGLPGDVISNPTRSFQATEGALTDGSTVASTSPSRTDGRSPPPNITATLQQDRYSIASISSTRPINSTFQNSPLISLFNESSIFDPAAYTQPASTPITPSLSSRLRQCLAQFASYLPRPERVEKFFEGTERYWPI